jgi:hypothetical protein
MNPAFDTLSASKRLRDAGVEERAADAIVELVQSATHFPDISDLATKADVADMATKRDVADLATATKQDVAELATKAALQDVKTDVLLLKNELKNTEYRIMAELNDKLRVQGMALIGGMAAIVGLATAIIKLAP